ncbi:MAG: lysylphosphatidylglycerol synthase transmembrane domain-containing protein [Ignavibacteriaceae bacterium]|nr:lysylphosphatidylglycerol synthase transmembrane domain-containing protein [Ignavibacteriaceae bacterium]
MKNKIKYLFLLLGIIFFGFLLMDFGIGNIVVNLEKTGSYFLPIIGVWLFVYLCNAVAFNFIINNKSVSFFRVLSITIRGYALNYMTPFFHLGGEPYRVIALKNNLGLGGALSATISYLLLHFLSSFLFWLIAIIAIFAFIPLNGLGFTVLILCFGLFLIAVFAFLKAYKNGVIKSLSKFIVKMPLFRRFSTSFSSREELLEEVNRDISDLVGKNFRKFLAANFFELLSRFIATLEFYFILRSIGYAPTILDSFLINAGASIISNLLFIVPFELGVKEGGLYLTLGLLKFPPELGIYIGIVNRLRELFWILVGLALISMSGDTVSDKPGIKNSLKALDDGSDII